MCWRSSAHRRISVCSVLWTRETSATIDIDSATKPPLSLPLSRRDGTYATSPTAPNSGDGRRLLEPCRVYAYMPRLENERTIAVDFELCDAVKNERRRATQRRQLKTSSPTTDFPAGVHVTCRLHSLTWFRFSGFNDAAAPSAFSFRP